MTDLSEFVTDRDVVREGDWITVGRGDKTFEIRTRGMWKGFRDYVAGLRLEAARELNSKLGPTDVRYTPDTLPPSLDDKCQGRAAADRCILGVRGLMKGGQPVTVEEFKDLLRDPDGRMSLLVVALNGIGAIGATRQEEQKEAEGN